MTDPAALMLSRRRALMGAAGLAVTFVGSAAFAAADGALARRKLVVIVLRGAMDGLSAAPPYADPSYAAYRGRIAIPAPGQAGGALKVDGTFALHPSLAATHKLMGQGQALLIPAVASPHRGRSHFDGQDVLENGSAAVYGAQTGWLNRALAEIAGGREVKALAVGDQTPLILRGSAPTGSWAPDAIRGGDAKLPSILMDLYAKDPLLGPALAAGIETQGLADAATRGQGEGMAAMAEDMPSGDAKGAKQAAVASQTAQAVGKLMAAEGGPSIVALSLYGFDTHYNQGAGDGLLAQRLAALDATIDGLRRGLGPAWSETVVMAVTEFGRTARINGTGGTDHGTGSAAFLAGGAVKPGGVAGDWPGLAEPALFEGRDLRPTLDVRGLFKGVLAERYGVSRAALDTRVFPGSAGVAPVAGLTTT